jgi:glucose-1-phosphate cytidylyltransferase
MIEEYIASEPSLDGIECTALDTGLDTPTGGRVKKAADAVGGETFCLTYVDGLADIDLEALLTFHQSHGRLATMTTVRPNLQWGVARIGEDDRVEAFVEKPRLDQWINGGFLCLEPGALDFIEEGDVLEEGPLTGLASADQLMAYRHRGFWDCVDTYKDLVAVNDLWDQGRASWLKSS